MQTPTKKGNFYETKIFRFEKLDNGLWNLYRKFTSFSVATGASKKSQNSYILISQNTRRNILAIAERQIQDKINLPK